jgi:hypothetical protein
LMPTLTTLHTYDCRVLLLTFLPSFRVFNCRK